VVVAPRRPSTRESRLGNQSVACMSEVLLEPAADGCSPAPRTKATARQPPCRQERAVTESR
jgi:hypothetical protein